MNGAAPVRPRRRPARAASAAREPGRVLLAWSAVLGAVLLAAAVLGGGAERPAEAADTRHGGELYQRWCATCHSPDASGIADLGPPIDAFSYARVDLSMRTGRMPLADPRRGVRDRTFTDAEREATMAYLDGLLELEGELPEPPAGDPRLGHEIYAVHCAQCHGASGKGGIAGEGVQIPPLVGLDPVTVAAGTRAGPFAMPPFGPGVVSDTEIGHIAAFLDEEVHEPTSPLGLAEVSRFEAVGFAALLAAAIVGACAWAGGARRRPDDGGEEHEA
jgi:ubiquinol-cytochrome c reductase cytochrome c subunit